ncbi:MAG: thiosulfate oxidation carrier complex protein SoxZ [Hyphomicrobiaceae bacterium]|nr:thiosulfate oxidation carrier complex protein SoxZ [Hyphomicrobiaceae bacterium]
MAQLPVRIILPSTAKKGDIIEIKTLIQHAMETGYRRDDVGKPIPRDIITTFAVTYGGVEVFKADFNQGVAANPYVAFTTIATESGELVFTWLDERGAATIERRKVTVS